MFTKKQQGVLRGVAAGFASTVVVLTVAVVAAPVALLPAPGFSAALAYALKWDLLILLCLAGNIGIMAQLRFFSPEDIDGGGLSSGTPRAKMRQAMLQNTLEQSVLAISTHVVWAATMPQHWQAAIAAATVLFVMGRILFWLKYSKGAAARSLGFALTFYPTAIMLLLVVIQLLTRQ